MEFTWEVNDYNPTEIKIQLQFKNAYKVSRFGVKDEIDINFL